MKTLKFKLQRHPRTQHLQNDLHIICDVYNHFVALTRRHYRIYGKCEGYKRASYTRLAKHLTKLKKWDRHEHWRIPYSWCLLDALIRIEFGYTRFFNKLAKRPTGFKSRKKYKSMTFDGSQVRVETVNEKIAKIRLNGQWYRFHASRPIDGNIRRVTVKRDTLDDFYITVLVDSHSDDIEPKTGKAAGFDFGLKNMLTCSDGEKNDSPQFYRQASNDIARTSRQHSKTRQGSHNRERSRKRLARVHRQIRNRRADDHWKLALKLVRKFDWCFFETLCLKGMQRMWGRKINDLGFATLIQKIQWQAKKRGKDIGLIDRWTASTGVCTECGHRQKLEWKDRTWTCDHCKTFHDRDVAAAIIIGEVGASTFELGNVRLVKPAGPVAV